MASRRTRRHATGVSFVSAPDAASDAALSPRDTVTLVQSGRLVRVAAKDRPVDPVSRETRVEDRPTLGRVYDKLFTTYKEPFVHKVFRSYGSDRSGLLTPDQLRAALDRLHLGLAPGERDRIVARVAPAQHGKVHYSELLRSLEVPQPLGDEAVAVARGSSVPGPPTVRPGGGGGGVRDGGKSFWNWERHGKERVPGLLADVREGTFEQATSDSLLTGLLAAKLSQHQHKLRRIFRRLDADRNSLIDQEEFVRGIAALRVNVSRAQAERLFELCDCDRSGAVDYDEFCDRFEAHGLNQHIMEESKQRLRAAAAASTAVPLAQSLGLSADEVERCLAHPLVHELARSLYGKGQAAAAVFQRRDMTRSGYLGVADLTQCCQALVPGIGPREVAAVMSSLDPATPDHVDYRAFLARLLQAGVANPRQLHSAPPGGQGARRGGGEAGALTRFGEPLTSPDEVPPLQLRSLSAVGTSRSPDVRRPTTVGGTGRTVRTALDDLHDVAVGPFLESLQRSGAAAAGADAGAEGAEGSGGGGGGGVAAGGGAAAVEALRGVTRSVDMGTLGRSGTHARAPVHSTARFGRFWERRYADTNHVTVADPASSQTTGREGTWVRKGENDDFLAFQAKDRSDVARRREQAVQRHEARDAIDAAYSAADDASGANDGKLAVTRATRQRFEERSEMYDRLRQMQNEPGHTFFGRPSPLLEHQLEGANVPNRIWW